MTENAGNPRLFRSARNILTAAADGSSTGSISMSDSDSDDRRPKRRRRAHDELYGVAITADLRDELVPSASAPTRFAYKEIRDEAEVHETNSAEEFLIAIGEYVRDGVPVYSFNGTKYIFQKGAIGRHLREEQVWAEKVLGIASRHVDLLAYFFITTGNFVSKDRVQVRRADGRTFLDHRRTDHRSALSDIEDIVLTLESDGQLVYVPKLMAPGMKSRTDQLYGNMGRVWAPVPRASCDMTVGACVRRWHFLPKTERPDAWKWRSWRSTGGPRPFELRGDMIPAMIYDLLCPEPPKTYRRPLGRR